MRNVSLALAGALLASLFAPSSAAASGIKVGAKVPDFKLRDAKGRPVSLYKHAGNKTLVLLVIATRCPYSRAFDHVMAKLPKRFKGRHVRFLAINPNATENAREVARHARKNGFSFPVFKDRRQRVVDALGSKVTPEAFVISAQRKLVYRGAIGCHDDPTVDPRKTNAKDLVAALSAHLAGKKPARKRTRAFGCTIKR